MNFAAVPPALGESASCVVRAFGAGPYRTDGDLLGFAFADENTLWSVEEPGVVRCWDLASQQQTKFHVLDDPATLWAFSAQAGFIAAGSDELQVWNLKSGDTVAGWPETSWISSLAFSPTGALIATGHDDGIIRLWDPGQERFLREFRAHSQSVSALAFSNDGKRLASSGEDKAIHLWELASGKPIGSFLGHTDRVPALAWHPDGKRFLSAGWDTTARVWDLARCEPIMLLNAHAGQVLTFALAPHGTLLACADSAHAIHIWDLATYRTAHVVQGQAREVRTMAWSPDSRRLVAGGADRVIHLLDAQQGSAADKPNDPQASRTNLALGAGGRQLLSLGAGTGLRVWDVAEGKSLLKLEKAEALRAFAASPNGRWIAGSRALAGEPASWHEGLRDCPDPPPDLVGLWDAHTGKLVRFLAGPYPPVTALAFSPDSAQLAAGGFMGEDIWLWNVADGEPALLIPEAAAGCAVEAIAWHPQRRLLAVCGIDYMATGGNDGRTGVWDVDRRHPRAWLPGGGTAVAFHPQGRYLAIASLVQTVRIWDASRREPVRGVELIGHLDAVTCLAYSPDGRLLATGSDDHSVRLWDADNGLQRGQTSLDTQIKALAFSPDGRFLYTGNGNTSCYQLDVRRLGAEKK